MIIRKLFCRLRQLFANCFFLIPYVSLFANAPDILESKKLSVSFNVPAKNATGVHEFYILDAVNSAGYYWKTSNDSSDTPNWSKERYNYRKTGNSTGNLTVINSSGEPTLLELSFSSSTNASCNLFFWSMTGGQLVKESHTGTATVSLSDLILSDIPDGYQVSKPSGYYAPASVSGGTLSAQDSYWSIYNESVIFNVRGNFSANITNNSGSLSGSGSSYTYTKTGTNSAILTYTIDGAGHTFEYDFQFSGKNTGIYSKYANYGGGTTDVTTGPFSLSGVAVPEQFSWEDYDDCNGPKIETSRWSPGYWDGGNAPSLGNGKITFSGNTVSGFKTVLPTTGMLAFNSGIKDALETSFASSDSKQSHSFLELANNDVKGIEVEVQLPMDVDSNTAIGLYTSDWSKAFSSDQSDKSFFGLDLWRDHIDIEYVDPQTGSMVSSNLTTQPGKSHIFSFLFKNGMVSMYVDGAKVAEFSSANFSRDSIVVRSWNNAGTPFSAHLKNARVLRNWEDYDQFSDNLLDTSKWTATNNYFVGNQPTETNGRIELSGLTSQHSNTFLLFKNSEGIDGVEADIWLPSNAPVDTGVLIGIADAGTPVGYLDLWAGSAQTHFSIGLGNSSTGDSIDFTRNAELGKMYKVAIIKGEQKTALYLDGEKVAEVSTWQSNNLDIIFRGVNDAGSSFTAYLDNVRVLRNWEDYDDFSSGSLDTTKWELAWWKGGRSPSVVNRALELGGSGDPNDPASDSMPSQLNLLTIPENASTHPFAIITDSFVYGLEAEIMLPSGTQYSTGLNFLCFDTTSQKADGSFKQFGPEIEYWSGQNPALEYQYLDPSTSEIVQVSIPAKFGVYYKASLIQDGLKSLIFIDGKKVAEFDYPDFSPNAYGFFAFNDDGHAFMTYVKNVRVLRRSTNTTQPAPVTVVSDPNGKAVVTQVGNEYKWNSTLDGVTLWGVWNDEDKGWTGATIQYVSGKQKGSIGLTDQVGTNLEVNHSYVVDENGTIKVTENTAYQYYQVTSVQNGVIETKDGSTLPLSDTSKFFTTRAAAEEYYYSKVNPKDWMWFDHYPWVYSNEMQEWLYFYPSGSKLLYYSNKNKAWREFN
jgi:hypothetical protein